MLVIDASVTLAWVFPDEGGAFAASALQRLLAEGATVPALWSVEVGNGLLVGERSGRLRRDDLARALALLRDLPVRVAPSGPETDFGQVLALARRHSLTAYDAAYLELAARAACPLATLDGDLAEAAEALGLGLPEG